MWWATVGGRLYATEDAGRSWRVVHFGPGLHQILASAEGGRHFFVSGDEGIYETSNGLTFQLMNGSPKRCISMALGSGLLVVSGDEAKGGLWRFQKEEWRLLRADPTISSVAVSPVDSTKLAITTDDDLHSDSTRATGVWISTDAGGSWHSGNGGLPCLRETAVVFNPHDPDQLVLATPGLGFWTARWPDH
jgi:hypothetical protein